VRTFGTFQSKGKKAVAGEMGQKYREIVLEPVCFFLDFLGKRMPSKAASKKCEHALRSKNNIKIFSELSTGQA